MQSFEIKLNTPIFTGSARAGEMKRIQETSIIGSLRWWYEAIIRGFGGYACDLRDADRACSLDQQKFKAGYKPGMEYEGLSGLLSESGLCPVCQLFGANGWAKQFSLQENYERSHFLRPFGLDRDRVKIRNSMCKFMLPEMNKEQQDDQTDESHCYYFPEGIQSEHVELKIRTRQSNDQHTQQIIGGLLAFIQQNAALGAKTNLGYGRFEWIVGRKPDDGEKFVDWVKQLAEIDSRRRSTTRSENLSCLPDLRKMFFIELPLTDIWSAQNFCCFKYRLRKSFHHGKDIERSYSNIEERKNLRHFLFGTTSDTLLASKIKLALSEDRMVLYLWGWIPDCYYKKPEDPASRIAIDRETILSIFQEFLRQQKCFKNIRWREFNTSRDNVEQTSDMREYILSLLTWRDIND